MSTAQFENFLESTKILIGLIMIYLNENGILVSAKYSCGFSNTLISSIIAGERYLDYFTTITEDRLWQLLAKPVFIVAQLSRQKSEIFIMN